MDNTYTLLAKAYQKMNAFMLEEMEKQGLGHLVLSHGAILMELHNVDCLNYKELAQKINKSPQTMTTLVRKLEKHDLVEISYKQDDKRNKVVSITTEGLAVFDVMMGISKSVYEKQYNGFSKEEIENLRSTLMKLGSNF